MQCSYNFDTRQAGLELTWGEINGLDRFGQSLVFILQGALGRDLPPLPFTKLEHWQAFWYDLSGRSRPPELRGVARGQWVIRQESGRRLVLMSEEFWGFVERLFQFVSNFSPKIKDFCRGRLRIPKTQIDKFWELADHVLFAKLPSRSDSFPWGLFIPEQDMDISAYWAGVAAWLRQAVGEKYLKLSAKKLGIPAKCLQQ